jgi:hypothetical protein
VSFYSELIIIIIKFIKCNFYFGNVVLLCGERRVKKTLFSRVGTEKITSGEGHEWFLESPQPDRKTDFYYIGTFKIKVDST